jgi:hypothetical protein
VSFLRKQGTCLANFAHCHPQALPLYEQVQGLGMPHVCSQSYRVAAPIRPRSCLRQEDAGADWGWFSLRTKQESINISLERWRAKAHPTKGNDTVRYVTIKYLLMTDPYRKMGQLE